MPELPEVEALRDFLVGSLVGHQVRRVLPVAISVLKTYDPPVTAFEGREVTGVRRYGKFLGVEADGGELHLVTHLARAGWLRWKDRLPDAPPRPGGKSSLALRVALETGEGFDLTEAGTQKRLAVYVVRDPAQVPGVARLGPDPLADEFDVTRFAGLLAGERRQIKGALRDQSLIAGIGNAYSDEILHAARMSPFKLASSLRPEETRHLYEALRTTLTEAVERSRGLAAGRLKAEKKSGLRVHGRAGEPCPVCGDTVREVSFSDSSLQYCPTCQTGGKPLADRRLSRLLK
ncbi:Fpg/Nei family DNA glycosylase [Streptomyces stelliscabiei]|uniref:Fpg/Nei family DNA glycosylase n=1 Tax=Streptomyces stelliscabiei TaxID=146820 RepID=UPI0029B87710|nr:DNA-formamidopyrimidine glycosylase family protein [Streptomyces stelliscabiei]MDX2553417.1 Fpg/Nei family DNA glycosylase [Streptomyces stelliscabiei]MDX2612453.1 Fpg/Nei family DNA glycosylase [Streptomyces stelliscabiei]MDX2637673.1 Fpg/Nei family DNA glycosylase [Streptomyces stelliscabiei]MDX2663651.1 Fpg/Nei family DNA glycosylase [Streptomyces stelliscabiei]MDX2717087.1 Fpg/Nei family DNA glycosylase [Streptomyces stelliscabiei]